MNKRRRYKAKRRRYARKHPATSRLMFASDTFDIAMRSLSALNWAYEVITVYGTGRVR